MRVDFYQLGVRPLERVLPSICEKLLSGGERLLIVADAARLPELDGHLWTYGAGSFLPHGRAGETREADQPILLSSEPHPSNAAANIAIADGRWRDEALGFARAFFFFDAATLDHARASWRALAGRGDVERHYHRQDENGRWEAVA